MDDKNTSGQNLKEIGKLFLHSPALLITGIVILAVVGYVIIKNGGGSNAMPTTGTGTGAGAGTGSGTGTGNSYYVVMDELPAPVTNVSITGSPVTVAPPVTITTAPPPPVVVGTGTPPPSAPNPSPAPVKRVYTVKSGDTLSAIAARLGTTWQNLFNMNQSTIINTSNQHGNPIPGGPQNNIFPGEQIDY